MELLNVRFLFADCDLFEGDLIIWLPVLSHLLVDTRTLLERNRASLDGTDRAEVQGIKSHQDLQQVWRMVEEKGNMVSHIPLNDANRPRDNYYNNRME